MCRFMSYHTITHWPKHISIRLNVINASTILFHLQCWNMWWLPKLIIKILMCVHACVKVCVCVCGVFTFLIFFIFLSFSGFPVNSTFEPHDWMTDSGEANPGLCLVVSSFPSSSRFFFAASLFFLFFRAALDSCWGAKYVNN